MTQKPLYKRLLSFALALLVVLSSVHSAVPALQAMAAETGYVKLQVGDKAWMATSEYLYRSDAATTGTAFAYYSMWDTGQGDLRDFKFNMQSWTGNKNYDPNTRLYCVQHGATISNSPQYTAVLPSGDSWWTGLSEATQIGILLCLGFGSPAKSADELDTLSKTLGYDEWATISEHDAAAATQILIGEFEQGYRTQLTGLPDNTSLYHAYIVSAYGPLQHGPRLPMMHTGRSCMKPINTTQMPVSATTI